MLSTQGQGQSSGSAAPLAATYEGFVGNTIEALMLFEACLQGTLFHTPRRPHDRERETLIRSGAVFIYEEHSSGIKRWTDGFNWSPSRILGNFLIYRELDGTFPPGEKRRARKPKKNGQSKTSEQARAAAALGALSGSSSAAAAAAAAAVAPGYDSQNPEQIERSLVGSLVDSYPFKEGGLVKKTISVQWNGVPHHLVSYYRVEDVREQRLVSVSDNEMLRGIMPRSALFSQQNFRNPVTDHDSKLLVQMHHVAAAHEHQQQQQQQQQQHAQQQHAQHHQQQHQQQHPHVHAHPGFHLGPRQVSMPPHQQLQHHQLMDPYVGAPYHNTQGHYTMPALPPTTNMTMGHQFVTTNGSHYDAHGGHLQPFPGYNHHQVQSQSQRVRGSISVPISTPDLQQQVRVMSTMSPARRHSSAIATTTFDHTSQQSLAIAPLDTLHQHQQQHQPPQQPRILPMHSHHLVVGGGSSLYDTPESVSDVTIPVTAAEHYEQALHASGAYDDPFGPPNIHTEEDRNRDSTDIENHWTLGGGQITPHTDFMNHTPVLNSAPSTGETPVLNPASMIHPSSIMHSAPGMHSTPALNSTPVITSSSVGSWTPSAPSNTGGAQ